MRYELDELRLAFRFLAWARNIPVKVCSGLYSGPTAIDSGWGGTVGPSSSANGVKV